MSIKNKTLKIGLITSLIILAIICGFLASKKNNKLKLSKNADSSVLSTWDMDMTPQKKDIASLSSYIKKDDMMYMFCNGMIFKWDCKSSEFRPACDDPTCDHTEEGCKAYLPCARYECVSYYNDHWIFVEKDGNNRYYLGYCDFDGNNRKKVIDISEDVQGFDIMMYLDFYDGKIYLSYNSLVTINSDSGWDTKVRLCVMEYDVKLIGSNKAYSRELLVCDDETEWHLLSVCDGKMSIDVPVKTADPYNEHGDFRIYNLNDLSYTTFKNTLCINLFPNGYCASQEKDGLFLINNEKRIRLDDPGWIIAFYDDNRIYAINTIYRQRKSYEDGVTPDAELKVYDFDGHTLDHLTLPKDYSIIGSIALFDGRFYMTNIDRQTSGFFYVYDTQNPDKKWKKITRKY